LVRETHQNPEVIQALNERFIPVRLEGRSHMDLVQQFGVKGAPTTILLSPDGTEKHRFVGFQAAAELLQELAQSGLG
jgi:thiol:disulfide interchange protein